MLLEASDDEDRAREFSDANRRLDALRAEIRGLKSLLRERGISQTPSINGEATDSRVQTSITEWLHTGRIKTPKKNPNLCSEVFLQILEIAMTSETPIIDPLSRSRPLDLTDEEAEAGVNVAIAFTAVSKPVGAVATRLFWAKNSFVFTRPAALRKLADVPRELRAKITSVTFRVIARYYSSDPQHLDKPVKMIGGDNVPIDFNFPVAQRPKDKNVEGEMTTYSWLQVSDFLVALRFSPEQHIPCKAMVHPRLLPKLKCLRMDLVNFAEFSPCFGINPVVIGELKCSIDELIITGLPCTPAGRKARGWLTELGKDNGLFIDGSAAYVQHKGCHVQPQLVPRDKCNVRVLHPNAKEGPSCRSRSSFRPQVLPVRAPRQPTPCPRVAADNAFRQSMDGLMWREVPMRLESTASREWELFDKAYGLACRDLCLYPTAAGVAIEVPCNKCDGAHDDEDEDDHHHH